MPQNARKIRGDWMIYNYSYIYAYGTVPYAYGTVPYAYRTYGTVAYVYGTCGTVPYAYGTCGTVPYAYAWDCAISTSSMGLSNSPVHALLTNIGLSHIAS